MHIWCVHDLQHAVMQIPVRKLVDALLLHLVWKWFARSVTALSGVTVKQTMSQSEHLNPNDSMIRRVSHWWSCAHFHLRYWAIFGKLLWLLCEGFSPNLFYSVPVFFWCGTPHWPAVFWCLSFFFLHYFSWISISALIKFTFFYLSRHINYSTFGTHYSQGYLWAKSFSLNDT